MAARGGGEAEGAGRHLELIARHSPCLGAGRAGPEGGAPGPAHRSAGPQAPERESP